MEDVIVGASLVWLFLLLVAVMIIISPLVIWHKLSLLLRETKAHNREVEKYVKRIKELLDILTTPQEGA